MEDIWRMEEKMKTIDEAIKEEGIKERWFTPNGKTDRLFNMKFEEHTVRGLDLTFDPLINFGAQIKGYPCPICGHIPIKKLPADWKPNNTMVSFKCKCDTLQYWHILSGEI